MYTPHRNPFLNHKGDFLLTWKPKPRHKTQHRHSTPETCSQPCKALLTPKPQGFWSDTYLPIGGGPWCPGGWGPWFIGGGGGCIQGGGGPLGLCCMGCPPCPPVRLGSGCGKLWGPPPGPPGPPPCMPW